MKEIRIRIYLITICSLLILLPLAACIGSASAMQQDVQETPTLANGSYTIVDSGQNICYNNQSEISCPAQGGAFYGQDAQYDGNQPSYVDNGDGTVSDLNTGLTWQQSPDRDGDNDIDAADKLAWSEMQTYIDTLNAQNYGGYNDWRLPSIKELYSLTDFSGVDPSGYNDSDTSGLIPFIDTDYFEFGYGDTGAGERIIDAQFASSTLYVSTTMNGDQTLFGVNFADGRIKGYGLSVHGSEKTFYVIAVCGNTSYGVNDYLDNSDGSITDQATGLMWSQADSGAGMDWESALAWVAQKNFENYLGYDDWRLPDAKELQSIVDYTRSPATSNSAAIDPLFSVTTITDEGGGSDYPYYWSSTTHANWTNTSGASAVYIAFGEALGWMQFPNSSYTLLDVHGAGAQRSDPKSGNPADWPYGNGPQGDVIRIDNYVRLVRDADSETPNIAPTADAGGPYAGQQGDTITLDGSISSDNDGSIVLYEWDLDYDGQYDDASGMTVDYSAGLSGSFMVGLRVTDDDGAQDSDTATIEVSAVSNGGPSLLYLPLVIGNTLESDDAEGYNLFAPLNSTTTYLIAGDGDTVYSWPSTYRPGNSVYLLENGDLLRSGNTNASSFDAGGAGGIVEQIAPDGEVAWDFTYDSAQVRLHHDIEPLPNGNILMIAWELKSENEAIAAGRDPNLLRQGELWPDHIIEVDPTSDTIVWEWHIWDHLVQDYDPTKANYGVVADHPELVDLNYSGGLPGGADWNHSNAIDYNAELDQILLSVHNFSEIWIIDHSTTTAQAAGHSGGNSGHGGDLLYRWGNPQTYDSGGAADQQLFVQHDAQWIPDGLPGAGDILIFNNGTGRSGGNYSSIDEIIPPVDASGNYALAASAAYGPSAPTWSYSADTPTDFYAERISGAQRLSNGNTLICDGPHGYFFEITSEGEIVWPYDVDGNVFRVTRYPASYAGLPDLE